MNCQKCRSTGCKRIDAVKSPVRRDREGAVTITVFITHVSHTSPALTAGDNVTDCITVTFFLLIFEEEKSYHRACACERVRWVRTPSNNGVAFGWCSCFGITVFFFFVSSYSHFVCLVSLLRFFFIVHFVCFVSVGHSFSRILELWASLFLKVCRENTINVCQCVCVCALQIHIFAVCMQQWTDTNNQTDEWMEMRCKQERER